MARSTKALVATALLGLVAASGPDRPAWRQPPGGVRLAARDVVADPGLPLPPTAKRALYVFTRGALTRADLRAAREAGLRYLGVLATNAYTFVLSDLAADPRAFLASHPRVIGTALSEPADRIASDLRPHLQGNLPLPRGLFVTFWPHATAAELRDLAGPAAETARLPRDGQEAVMEERIVRIEHAAATLALLDRLASSPLVASIDLDYPIVEHNAASRALSHADSLASMPYGLDGDGVLVGHWDGGTVSAAHGDFGGRVTNEENAGVSSHATHTAGTVLGSGAGRDAARGYAPRARMVAYTFYGDATGERRAAKHEHYHEHDNHSWGDDSGAYGGYSARAQTFDLDSRDLLMLAVKSAGNDGQRSQMTDQGYGFDSLAPDSTCKNILIIGATQDDGALTGFSSRGPTNDGRIKPDVSANGNNLTSTLPSGRYGSMSGTSMSAPSVTGMIALLSQLYKRENGGRRWAPDEIRAVMIHTVTDVFHRGPDYRHGWGNADAKAAADLILADAMRPGLHLARGAVREGEAIEYALEVGEGAPELKVTMTWLDATANSTAERRLIHDLDLELVAPSGARHFPWTLDPARPFSDAVRDEKNDLDNVEQVLVDNPEPGRWTARIAAAAITDPDLPVQGFVLATSHAISRAFERIAPREAISASGLAIPDGDPAGLVLTFAAQDPRPVKALRLHLDVKIEERGQLAIELVHPDGTSAKVEGSDTSTRRDIFAVFPDTRSYDDDVTALFGKPAAGAWQLKIADARAGVQGHVLSAMLEIDYEGEAPPPVNGAPTANAGKDQSVASGDEVQLDGTLSSDPDGDRLSFQWQQQAGPPAGLSDPTSPMPRFVAPSVQGAATIVLRLTVDDGRGGTASDDVAVRVLGAEPEAPMNRDPIARTNGSRTVPPKAGFTLDASASSDPDGDTLMFRWLQSSGPEIAIADPERAVVTLVAPDAVETVELAFRVEVSDGRGGVDLDDVVITVASGAPPVEPEPAPEGPEAPGAPGVLGEIGGSCACVSARGARTADLGSMVLAGLLALATIRRRARSRAW